MKLIRLIGALSLLAAAALGQTTPPSPTEGIRSKSPDLKAFTNATIVVSPELTIEKGTLLIKDGYIVEVGAEVTIPAGAELLDMEGYTIYAGFIDPFTDYGLGGKKGSGEKSRGRGRNRELKFDGTRTGGNAWNDAIHAEQNWVSQFKPSKDASKKLFDLGYTTVQSCKLDGIFRGRSFVTLLGEGLPNDLILRPYSNHFASFNKGTSRQEYPGSLMGSIALIRQTWLDVEWYQKAHASYELNPNQKMPEFNRAVEALAEASGETFVFDPGGDLSLFRAHRMASEFGVNLIQLGSGYEYSRLDDVKATGTRIILPVNFPKTPELSEQDDDLDATLGRLRHWERAPSNASVLEQSGIEFALTTNELKDKKSFLKNVKKAIKRGLTEKTALAALTTVPAAMCGISDLAGTLERSKLANFFVCDGNIFEKKTKIFSVWVRGHKNELESMPTLDVRGSYMLSFSDLEYRMTIDGEVSKLSGKLKSGDDKIKLKNLNLSLEKLSFSVKLDTNDIKGIVRFSGRMQGEELRGYGTLPNGDDFGWSATVAPDEPEEEDDEDSEGEEDGEKESHKKGRRKDKGSDEDGNGDEEDDEEDDEDEDDDKPFTMISKLTHPNIAFGFETLPQQEDVLIKNATVWTSESDGILENTDVLVKKGKFKKIGKNLQAPSGVRVIDATGKHMTAGIIDAHSHIAISSGVNECTEAITAEVRIGDVVNPEHISIYRQLAGGTTMAHLLHGSCNAMGGQSQLIKLRWGSNSEQLKFEAWPPTIKFALGENVKRSSWGREHRIRYPQTRMGIEAIISDEFQTAVEYEKKWNDYTALGNKGRRRTIPPRRDLELEAVTSIVNSELFIHCHSYVQSEILMLMRVADKFGFVVQNFTHILEGYKVAPEMAKHGATASAFSDWWAYKFEVYDAIPYNVALMAEKGVVASINSDNADLASRLNQEAGKSVKYGGVAPEEAIKFATLNSAIQLKVDDRVGSIKVGKDADFVIWNDYPLSVYARAEQTWIEGTKYFDLESDKKLREELKKERNALIQKVLSSPKDKKGGDKKDWKKRGGDNEGYKQLQKEWHCDDCYDYWERINNAQ